LPPTAARRLERCADAIEATAVETGPEISSWVPTLARDAVRFAGEWQAPAYFASRLANTCEIS
jgi:hypothetical protein